MKQGRGRPLRSLGSLESQIMEILWEAKEPIKGRTIYEKILSKRHIAYTTVMTVLERLTQKGFARKKLAQDRAYVFQATLSKHRYIQDSSKTVLMELLSLSSPAGVAAFVDTLYTLDQKTVSELEKCIKEKMEGET
ncbi:MAG: BlaI/MecI/CopY family transcriptional regulator [Nitrospirota bacterium]|nr:BlaI/MecI/CopY family transcriptional regulator [Nitrospirota bacterium]